MKPACCKKRMIERTGEYGTFYWCSVCKRTISEKAFLKLVEKKKSAPEIELNNHINVRLLTRAFIEEPFLNSDSFGGYDDDEWSTLPNDGLPFD